MASHVHVDGPIPGPHSLLTVAAAAYTACGDPISTFTVNLRRLARSTMHADAHRHWALRAEDWLATRCGARPVAPAVRAFARWTAELPGPATLVVDADGFDHVFLFWYLHRFAGCWPFARTRFDAAPGRFEAVTACRLSGCRSPQTVPQRIGHH